MLRISSTILFIFEVQYWIRDTNHRYHSGLTTINKLKKDMSIGDVQSQQTIYQLTRAMVGEESYKITPGTCTHVALMVCHSASRSQHHLTVHSIRRIPNTLVRTFGISWTRCLMRSSWCPRRKDLGIRCPRQAPKQSLTVFPSSFLKMALQRDCRTYGVVPGTAAAAPSDDTAASDESLIQQRIHWGRGVIYPVGTLWVLVQFAPTIPSGSMLSILWKNPSIRPPKTQWVKVWVLCKRTHRFGPIIPTLGARAGLLSQ